MSEAEHIVDRFQARKDFETLMAGKTTAVCVAGHVSYEALRGCLMASYNGIGTFRDAAGKPRGFIEFEGVRIYPSASFEEGFYFGHEAEL